MSNGTTFAVYCIAESIYQSQAIPLLEYWVPDAGFSYIFLKRQVPEDSEQCYSK